MSPDQIMVARDSAVSGVSGEHEQEFFETAVLADLLHLVRREPLPAGQATGNSP